MPATTGKPATPPAAESRNGVLGIRIPPPAPFGLQRDTSPAGWTQAANDQGANLRYPIKVPVDVHHAHAMVKSGFGN